jgi:hypothetical protein
VLSDALRKVTTTRGLGVVVVGEINSDAMMMTTVVIMASAR